VGLLVRPTGDLSAIRIDVFEWSNKEQKEVMQASFYVIGRNGGLEVKTFTNWDTRKADPLAAQYYDDKGNIVKIPDLKVIRVESSFANHQTRENKQNE
jgi:hypothetical protein